MGRGGGTKGGFRGRSRGASKGSRGGFRRKSGGRGGGGASKKIRQMDEMEEKHLIDTYDVFDGRAKKVEINNDKQIEVTEDRSSSGTENESEEEDDLQDLLKEFGKYSNAKKKSFKASDDEDSEEEGKDYEQLDTDDENYQKKLGEENPIDEERAERADEVLLSENEEESYLQSDEDETAQNTGKEIDSGGPESTPMLEETGERSNTSDEDADSDDDQEEGNTNYISHLEWEPEEQSFPPEPFILKATQPQSWPEIGQVKIQQLLKSVPGVPEIPLKAGASVALKKILADNLKEVLRVQESFEDNSKSLKSKLNPFEDTLLNILNSYRDFYYPERTWERAESLRLCYTLHCMNHILRSRARSIRHSMKIRKSGGTAEFQDQGLTRVKVLIILPFKNSAYRVVKLILKMVDEIKLKVINEERFEQEFRPPDDDSQGKKPDDYYKFFEGDSDDMFRIGLRFTKRRVQLYANFYSADMIIASPVGLRAIIGAEGDEKRDFDFLSSIEIVVLDQTDVFFMQNWEHLIHIFKHFHQKPKESHGVDFSRVRTWSVNEWSKYFRQNIIISQIHQPQINALLKRYNFNYRGLLSSCNQVEDATIAQVVVQIPQIFRSFEPKTVGEVSDARFKFFTEEILPQLMRDNLVSHCMIYIRQYFDFVRLRNFMRELAETNASFKFCQISEYTESGKVAQARYQFFHGKRTFLLYTERFHFFHRYVIKGIRHIVFYELPTYPHFYSELVNMMTASNQFKLAKGMESTFTATNLYCKYDILALKPILGEGRAASVVHNVEKKVHLFTRD